MASVTLKDIVKRFGKTEVIHGVNLDISDREFMVLVGPSGCGKSTVLRLIAGLEKITKGDILIDDRVVNDIAPKDRGAAMVFQNYALYPHMDVFNNMSFGLKLNKTPKTEIQRRVNEVADILELSDLLKRKPYQLSGGQRQRVAMGRAMVRKPSIFLFDEPLSNLDAKLRTQMRTEIKLLHQKVQTTIIYVTHDQVEAMTMGDRIVVLKDGYVMQSDAPLNIYERPDNRFVAGFIGSPAMNFFDVNVTARDEVNLQNDHMNLRLPGEAYNLQALDGQSVTLGIRPEHLVLSSGGEGIAATLDVSELMGNESYLYGHAGGTELVARVQDTSPRKTGDDLSLKPQMEKLHFFDADSGERIAS